MFRLVTFGGLRLESGAEQSIRLRRPWLAVLAALAAAGEHGLSRARLIALLWPESDEEHARLSARQALYGLRQEVGHDAIVSSGPDVSLSSASIVSDVAEFRSLLAAGDRRRAVELARAPFLDAFHLPGTAAFERWVEEERSRLAGARTSALVALATDATRTGQWDAAIEWWRELTDVDPLSGRFAVGFLKALAARGDRAEALAFARQHGSVIRRELEIEPDPDVSRLENELRAMRSTRATRESSGGTETGEDVRGERTTEVGVAPDSMSVAPSFTTVTNGRRSRWRRLGLFSWVVAVALAVLASERGWTRQIEVTPTIAVGFIEEIDAPDSLRLGRVLTDMLATSLARVEGMRVLANSRLMELMRSGADSAAGYSDAARRAGAAQLLEGQVRMLAEGGYAIDMRRVDLRSGIVREGFRIVASNRYQLVDSLTSAVARGFRLNPPTSSVASATTTSAIAYRFYEEGLQAYFRQDRNSARMFMRAALEEDSTFAMAAYYEAMLAPEAGDRTPDGRHATIARQAALALAPRLPDRERLMVMANMLADEFSPNALAVAETLATRYPDDPRGLFTLGRVRSGTGDWAGSVAVLERAIRLDSLAEPSGSVTCRVCEDYTLLAGVYLWWDSLPAAARTTQRHLRMRPNSFSPLYLSAVIASRRGDSATTYASFRRLLADRLTDRAWKLVLDLRLEDYDEFMRAVPQLLASSSPHDWGSGAWHLQIALRNQGRMREAARFNRTGLLPGLPGANAERLPDRFHEGILALELGDAPAAVRVFRQLPIDSTYWSRGHVSRNLAWRGTLTGMALAATGDTTSLRALADSVEQWGRGSLYGRDRKSHHYLRGMVHVAAGRHEDAITEFRAAIHSPSLGFTRVNYEMAKSLLQLGRPREAVAVLQPSLRGSLDASNLYVTRTDLHELLARSFDRAGQPDSAAVHYRAVVVAWKHADAAFHGRRAGAVSWLAGYTPSASP